MAWIGGCGLCSPHTALPCSETRLPCPGVEVVQMTALGPARRGLGLPGEHPSRSLLPEEQPALPAQAAARHAGPACASTAWVGGLRPPPQECLGDSLVFGVTWISPGLTSLHVS